MNAIELAVKTETDAIGFYQKAAEKTSHPVGRKMFLAIVEDEKRHLEIVQNIMKGMDITMEDVSPIEKVKTVFEAHRGDLLERLPATTDDINALNIAMQMEKESYDLYEKMAASAASEKEKTLYQKLMKEEDQHYIIFNNTYQFLEDSGNWFMWDERQMVDGGTPWA